MFFVLLILVPVVLLAVGTHVAMLWAISANLVGGRLHSGHLIGVSVLLVLLAHLTEVVIFAVGYHLAVDYAGVGALKGEFTGNFQEYVYFSLVSYTSLGLGDVYPHGPVRLIAGVEALTGLLMIGWSASFTYFCMVKLWSHHDEPRQ